MVLHLDNILTMANTTIARTMARVLVIVAIIARTECWKMIGSTVTVIAQEIRVIRVTQLGG